MTAVQFPSHPAEGAPDSLESEPIPPRKSAPHAARQWMVDYGSRRILGMRVDGTTYRETTESVAEMAAARSGGMVCVATVHMVMEAFDDPGFQRIVNSADRVTPDGIPLVLALRLRGIPQAQRVYGPTLTPIVCERAADLGLTVGFYGGTPNVLDSMVQELTRRFPKLRVAFRYSPPFRPLSNAEDAAVVDAIQAAEVQVLFVGLGCPKQERWMAAHRDSLRCLMLGAGAAFDFLAGAKRQAPLWMRRRALEWLYRLVAEPRRLWRRYLIGNPRFLYHFAREGLRPKAPSPVSVERND